LRALQLDLRAPDEVEEGELDGPLLGEGATLTYKRKASRKGKQEWCVFLPPPSTFL